ncbi:MAG TPA: NUDIX domain-containing protein [Magnetospirillaceae bacterium]|jgi:ADP-ribose pyrophosphatase
MTSDQKIDGVDIQEHVTLFQSYFRLDRYTLRHKRFDGSWTQPITREVFERGHAAAVLLYDPVRDEVALIEQFRAGAMAAGWYPWLIEVVAGIIDEGEAPETTAIREAKEEAAATITDLVPITHVIASPGAVTETCMLYCGRADTTRLGGLHGMEEENEDIRLFTVPATEAIGWVESGKVNNAVAVIALLWLALNREKLKAKWA